MNIVELKLTYTRLLKEVGDLENIIPYEFSNSKFSTDEGLKIEVKFQEYDNRDLEALNINTEAYGPPIYNVSFDVNGVESQFKKTDLQKYLRIIKTVGEICKKFIVKNNPNGLIFFAMHKDSNILFSIDPQKTKYYKVTLISQLNKLKGWVMVNLKMYEDFEGFMIYNKSKIK